VVRRTASGGELPRTDIMSALPPPVSDRLPALTTTPTWTSALDVPPVTAPYAQSVRSECWTVRGACASTHVQRRRAARRRPRRDVRRREQKLPAGSCID
jgi:hypothetical protein